MMNSMSANRYMMSHGASADQAASASCAHSAEMPRTSMTIIALILDAILLASIIICALLVLAILVSVLVSVIALLGLVLLVNLLAAESFYTPRSRRGA